MSGSGASGEVVFPAHMQDTHMNWLGYDDYDSLKTSEVDRDLIEIINAAHAPGANPFEGVTYNDPTFDFDEVESAINDALIDVSAIDIDQDYSDAIALVKQKVDEVLDKIGADVLAQSASTASGNELAAIKAASGDEDKYKDIITNVYDKLTESGILEDISLQSMVNSAGDSAIDQSIVSRNLSPDKEKVDSIVTEAVTRLQEQGVIDDIAVDAIVTSAGDVTDSVLESAANKAASIISSSIVSDAVTAFEQRAQYSRDRAYRRFTGQMSDINAVHSSAFMFGLALIEAQHLQGVGQFHSEVSREQFNNLLGRYIELFSTQLSQEIQVAVRNKVSREEMMGQMFRIAASMFESHMARHIEAFQRYLGTAVQAAIQNKVSKEQGVVAHAGLQTQLYDANTEKHLRLFANQLQAELQAAVQNKVSEDNIIAQQVPMLFGAEFDIVNLRNTVAQMLLETKRIRTVAEAEFIGNQADMNRSYATWDMNVYAKAGATLGAIQGGHFVPDSASKTSSAIGGAMGGAAMGASLGSVVPGLGTAVGAGVGAVAGGLAGVL